MNTATILPAVFCVAALTASCHSNRPDVPPTQRIYQGSLRNDVYKNSSDFQLLLNTYDGHSYIDGEWTVYGNSRLLHEGTSIAFEGVKEGSRVRFTEAPSIVTRGIVSATSGKKAASDPDAIFRSNKAAGLGGSLFRGVLSGSTMSGTWISELSSADRQNNPGAAKIQYGSFSLKRQ